MGKVFLFGSNIWNKDKYEQPVLETEMGKIFSKLSEEVKLPTLMGILNNMLSHKRLHLLKSLNNATFHLDSNKALVHVKSLIEDLDALNQVKASMTESLKLSGVDPILLESLTQEDYKDLSNQAITLNWEASLQPIIGLNEIHHLQIPISDEKDVLLFGESYPFSHNLLMQTEWVLEKLYPEIKQTKLNINGVEKTLECWIREFMGNWQENPIDISQARSSIIQSDELVVAGLHIETWDYELIEMLLAPNLGTSPKITLILNAEKKEEEKALVTLLAGVAKTSREEIRVV